MGGRSATDLGGETTLAHVRAENESGVVDLFSFPFAHWLLRVLGISVVGAGYTKTMCLRRSDRCAERLHAHIHMCTCVHS